MTQLDQPVADVDRPYNRVAIDTAAAIHEHRLVAIDERRRSIDKDGPLPLDKLFPPFNRVPLGVALEYERMGNQPVSDDLASQAIDLGFELEHVGLTLGTVVHGIDLHPPVSDEHIAFVRALLCERKVVFFRDQHLDEDRQVALGRRFGGLDAFPFGPPGENPFILEIGHGRLAPGRENGWHTDVTWMEEPSLGSIAQLIDGPPVGGDTLFADSHAAYLGLTDDVQERVKALDGINDYRNFIEPGGRNTMPDELVAQIKDAIPFGVSHPLARTTRRRARRRCTCTADSSDRNRCTTVPRENPSARKSPRSWSPTCWPSTAGPNTSAGSHGRSAPSPSGTTGLCSTTPPATTGRTAACCAG